MVHVPLVPDPPSDAERWVWLAGFPLAGVLGLRAFVPWRPDWQ